MSKLNWFISSVIVVLMVVAVGYALHSNGIFGSEGETKVVSPTELVGQSAPDFSLQSLTDETVRLSDYKGQKIFLNFWAMY